MTRPRIRLSVERLEDRDVPAFAAGQVLVTFATDDPTHQLSQLTNTPLAESVEPLGFGVYKVDLVPGAAVEQALTVYSALPGVRAADPDQLLQVEAVPNDPTFSQQSALTKISAPAAWDRSTGTGQTIVAIIDSGADYTHPDLAANIWVNGGEVAGNGRDDDGNGYVDDVRGWDFANNDNAPLDDNRHGTHIAGIIGAVGNNGVGVTGINWRTRIMPLKFLNGSGSGLTSNAVRAVDYAVRHGAKVINASFGGGNLDAALSAAIGRARDAGVIFVAAAGNTGANNDTTAFYPANYVRTYDNVVTVAASDANDNLPGFSNRGGQTVTLAAPGVSVRSTLPNGGYGSLSGTSMAAPHVAGAIALLWDSNPSLTYRQVIDRLKASVDVAPGLIGQTMTGGRLNVGRLLGGNTTSPPATPPTTPPTVPPSSPPTTAGGPRVTAAAFAGPAANQLSRVRLTFSEPIQPSTFTIADVASIRGPGGTINASAVSVIAGTNNTQFDVTFPAQTAAGTYTFTLGTQIADTTGTLIDQNGNGVPNEVPADRFVATSSIGGSSAAGRTFSAGGLPVNIPDRASVSVPIVVNQDITVADVNVSLSLSHTYTSDLVIRLTSPTGQTVTLANRRGGSGDNFTNTLFDDEAAGTVVTGRAPFTGSFRAEQLLSAFDGRNARGTWTLTVQDAAAQDTGRVTGVSLMFGTTSAASAQATEGKVEPAAGWFPREERGIGDGYTPTRRPPRPESQPLFGRTDRATRTTEVPELTLTRRAEPVEIGGFAEDAIARADGSVL